MKRVIIGIHGLGNKPPHSILEKWWRKAISEGLQSICGTKLQIPFELVYWADILHEMPLDHKITKIDHPLYLSEQYQPAGEMAESRTPSLKTRMMRYAERQLDRVFLNPDMSINFSKVSDSVIRRYFSDLEAYYNQTRDVEGAHSPVREVIRSRLSQALKRHRHHQILLLAHSMGSIIAYDVLWELADEAAVHTFVTLGSPLGLPAIQHRIHQERQLADDSLGQLIAPPNIRKQWYNLADQEDHVALDHTLADDYSPNRQGLLAQDIDVRNDYAQGGRRNPHKIYGYLRTPAMARIADAFQSYQDTGWWQRTQARWRRWMIRGISNVNQRPEDIN